jgi:alkanesulfonate monooxygenase SsuD/methylene tetrahydromethanopterin reductase-like flavin-dependent oxidoreductase (luciferase family)
VNLTADAFKAKLDVLARHCEAEGRDPATIRKSMMMFGIVGASEADLDAASLRLMSMFGAPAGTTPAQFRQGVRSRGMISGGTDEVVDQIGRLAELGLEEIQFQHFNFDSDSVPEYLAAEIAPRVRGL